MAPGRIPDHCTRGKLEGNRRSDYMGDYIWNMFNSAPISDARDAIGMNDKGIVSYDRKNKRMFSFSAKLLEPQTCNPTTNSRFKIRKEIK